ncbi:alpha/beta-hydrolase [Mycena floridula]|nr:alpha/beta-hydrolase [Mycena floridula]
MLLSKLPVLPVWLAIVALATTVSATFSPKHQIKTLAKCPAVKRDTASNEETKVDIRISYADIGALDKEHTILMVHGWPGLWSLWAQQIQELRHNYRLIVPDLRGFGESTHPGNVKSSGTMFDMVDDLLCVLRDAGVSSVVCMGHDWGSQLCYEAARKRPDVFHAVIGIVVPYIPAEGPFVPVSQLTNVLPKLKYQLFFDTQTDAAIAELDKNITRTLRATLRTKDSPPPDAYLTSETSFLEAWSHVPKLPRIPFLSVDEEDYLIEHFEMQGFGNTLHFYTDENRRASWKHANEQGNHTIPVPVLAVYPRHDPVANWEVAAMLLKSASFLPHLTVETVDGAHWVHLENPKVVNSVIRKWLKKVKPFTPKKIWDEVKGTTTMVYEDEIPWTARPSPSKRPLNRDPESVVNVIPESTATTRLADEL